MSFKKLFALLVVLGLALSVTVMAQNVVTGDITGTVADKSGAVVPKAAVTATSDATGASVTTNTTSTGLYHFPLLQPGPYTIKASATDFADKTVKAEVLVGQVNTVNIKLDPKGTVEEVTVSAGAPLLQTENANIASTYSTTQITTLPNPGGDVTNIAQNSPGVLMNVGSGFGYGNFQAFGLPGTANLFTVNGNDQNDPFLNLNNSGSSNLLLGTNELQQAVVVSNGYTGQYGRQAGVQEDLVTKSGTNAFHGDLDYKWNGSSLNANDWFNNLNHTAKPFANSNEYAADLGGPIYKDKLFFYTDTEGLRYILPATFQLFLPSPAFEAATLSNIASVSPAALPFYQNGANGMFDLYNSTPGYAGAVPVGNSSCADLSDPTSGVAGALPGFGPGGGSCLNFLQANGKNLNREWLATGRIDYNISNNDKVFGRYKYDTGSQPTGTSIINHAFSSQSIQPEWDIQLNETHIFSPNAVNQAIISGLHYSAFFTSDSPSTVFSIFPTNLEPGAITFFPGDTNLLSNLGLPFFFPQGRKSTQYQGIDDFSLQRGSHALKMGVNFRRNDFTDFDSQIFTHGLVVPIGMFGFVNDLGLDIQNFSKFSEVPIAGYSVGAYFQDEWRVDPNLKLTLALRADRNSNEVCQTNCFSRLAATFPGVSNNPITPFNQIINTGQHRMLPNVDKVVMQPRFGLAWTPFGHSSTVVRAGVGIFSDLYPATLADSIINNAPNTNQFVVTGGLAPQDGAASVYGVAATNNAAFLSAFNSGGSLQTLLSSGAAPAFSSPAFFSTVGDLKNPKYVEWNMEIQHSFGSRTVLDLNYVGTHGYDLFTNNGGLNAYCSTLPGNTALGISSGSCFHGPATATSPLGILPNGFGGLPGSNTLGTPATAGGLNFGPIPSLGSVTLLTNAGVSNYSGLVTRLERRMGYGFQGSLNYTWSHSLDDVSNGGVLQYNTSTSLLNQVNPYSVKASYGNSDYDVRHNLTANYIWALPYKFQNTLAEEVLGGWEFSGTFYSASGRPYSAIDSAYANAILSNFNGSVLASFVGGPEGSCDRPKFDASGNQIAGCLTAANFIASGAATQFGAGRNQFRGPAYFDTDFSVYKNFKITERVGLRLGTTLYNALNHPNFANPADDIASGQFGQILSTAIQPTSPYGSFQGSAVSGRIVQLTGKLTF